MLTYDQIDKKIAAEKIALQLEAAERQTDAELEQGRREGKGSGYNTPKIRVVYQPPIHRSVLDKLVEMYRGPGKWSCTLWSPKHDSDYVGIEFERYVATSYGSGRD